MAPLPSHPSLPVHAIPGLELQAPIGEGGTSTVHRAMHRNLQRTVAVKLLRTMAGNEDASPSWLRESRLMASLAHPHVVAIHDAGQVEGYDYLVMEYMGGGSLRSRMMVGEAWRLADVVPLLNTIAEALEHIHGQGVLHLDLKPENILYTANGLVKITDFGLAVPNENVNTLLGGQPFRGTLDYCAPEYRFGLVVDGRYDVFSLATVAYELLTGRRPGRVYVPVSQRNPQLPPTLDSVLERGLARDPNDRYSSIAQFRKALSSACHSQEPRHSTRWLGRVGAVTVVGVISLMAYLWSPGPQPPTVSSSSILQVSSTERPDRLMILHDTPDDLSLVAGQDNGELANDWHAPVERVLVENPLGPLPLGLPLAVWPVVRPVLAIHSPRAWGFVHPLQDRSLGRRVVQHWPELLRTVVPPDRNLVRAGGFDGDCLAKSREGMLWRVGDFPNGSTNRQITIDRPTDQPENPALLLTNLQRSETKTILGCYQSLMQGPPPSATVVLRYRARSRHGKGSLAVYAGMPMAIPEGDTSPIANRLRALASPLPAEPKDSAGPRWLYRISGWITPSDEWQTYLVIFESPSFPNRVLHRNLVIDLTAAQPSATDQVWVDDVELFVWQPE